VRVGLSLFLSLSLSFSLVIDAKGPGASRGRERRRRGRTGAALDPDAEGDQGRARLLGGGPRRGRLARTGAGADGRGDGGGDGRGLARSSGGRWCFFFVGRGRGRRGGDELSVDVFRAAPQFAFRPPFRRCFGLLPMLLVSCGNVTEPFQGGENSGKRANGGPWQRALAKGLAKPRRRRQSPSRRIGLRARKKKRHHFFHSYLGSHSRRDADGAYHDYEKFFLARDREGSERAAEREAAKDELRSRAKKSRVTFFFFLQRRKTNRADRRLCSKRISLSLSLSPPLFTFFSPARKTE